MQNTAALLLGPVSFDENLLYLCPLICEALSSPCRPRTIPVGDQLKQPGSHEARPYNALGEPKQPYPISTENKVNFDMFSR